ncbi:MAG: phage tail tape measure protein [Roseibium sp.]
MAILSSTLRVGLEDRLSGKASRLTNRLQGLSRAGRRMRSSLVPTGMGAQLTGMTRRLVALGGAYVGYRQTLGKSFAFDDAFADVRKVIDTTPAGIAALRKNLLKMSTTLSGIKATGLAEIMAEAGQAGIAIERLGRFTQFTAKATVAFDMSAQATGNAFAKLGNVYQLNQTGLESLANTTNHLSNNMAAKAAEILNFTNRAAGAADMHGACRLGRGPCSQADRHSYRCRAPRHYRAGSFACNRLGGKSSAREP